MAKRSWAKKQIRNLAVNEGPFLLFWLLFFGILAAVFHACYFWLHPFSLIALAATPLFYFLRLYHKKHERKKHHEDETILNRIFLNGAWAFFLICAVLGALLSDGKRPWVQMLQSPEMGFFFFYIIAGVCANMEYDHLSIGWSKFTTVSLICTATFYFAQYESLIHGASYVLPILFYFGWILNAKATRGWLNQSIGQEWWLDITLDDSKKCRIQGEPHIWWEEQLRRPQAHAIIKGLEKWSCSGLSFSAEEIWVCDSNMRFDVEQWFDHLHTDPPTAKDWRQSGFDFSMSAQDKLQSSSHAGTPIAIPSLFEETKDNPR